MNNVRILTLGRLVIKIREPELKNNVRVCFLLHGWTGDESSMWVFSHNFGPEWLLIAPRAPFQTINAGLGGFSWADQSLDQWPTHLEFFQSVSYIDELVEIMIHRYPLTDFSKFSVFGFSQGAAMALVYSSVHNKKIEKLALLSGFLPAGSDGFIKDQDFKNIEVFIGHGIRDDVVSIVKADETNGFLENNCKSLTYCRSDVGHKLGADCSKALKKFINH